jgi:hypothetical protein
MRTLKKLILKNQMFYMDTLNGLSFYPDSRWRLIFVVYYLEGFHESHKFKGKIIKLSETCF